MEIKQESIVWFTKYIDLQPYVKEVIAQAQLAHPGEIFTMNIELMADPATTQMQVKIEVTPAK